MKTVAIIPIKLNNERLPGKNTKLLGDKPLVQYILQQLKQVASIDEIFVYCSDEEIKPYLLEGVTFLKRPAELDLPTSNFNQILDSFIKQVPADMYVYTHATAPFITADTINECIQAVQTEEFDSAFSAVEIQDYLWLDGKPLNFDAKNIPRSQDLQKIYRETSGIYVIKLDVYRELHQRVGNHPYIKPVSHKEAVDINEPEDFELAELYLNYQK